MLPAPRGPFSDSIISAFQRRPGAPIPIPSMLGVDALTDDDFQLALYLCYEVHYQGLIDAEWEWDPGLLTLRAQMEQSFVNRLCDEVGTLALPRTGDVRTALDDLIGASDGPSLSTYMSELGTFEQMCEFCVHRSAYQLKEADPHSFGIPRLAGEAKAALVEIQYDEYGSGDYSNMHSTLFGVTMESLGLDATYGSYVELLPGITLATVNLVSMFGLHRRWRAALVGHLAVFEMTSIGPMARYSNALERLGIGPRGRRFYDVHVTADARHSVVARDQMVAGLIRAEPQLQADLLFGASSVLMLEQRFARHLLDAWEHNQSSLIQVAASRSGR